MYVYVCVCMCTCVYACVCVCTCVCAAQHGLQVLILSSLGCVLGLMVGQGGVGQGGVGRGGVADLACCRGRKLAGTHSAITDSLAVWRISRISEFH